MRTGRRPAGGIHDPSSGTPERQLVTAACASRADQIAKRVAIAAAIEHQQPGVLDGVKTLGDETRGKQAPDQGVANHFGVQPGPRRTERAQADGDVEQTVGGGARLVDKRHGAFREAG